MAFSFKTKPRWKHGVPVVCNATLSFTTTQSGREQIQVEMTDSAGNRQFSWTSLESVKAEGVLSNRLRPFINHALMDVEGYEPIPSNEVIDRESILSNLKEKIDGKTLRSIIDGSTIQMSVITVVGAGGLNGGTRTRVISFMTPSERSDSAATNAAQSLNQSASAPAPTPAADLRDAY